jgi:hypothetical protein
MYRTGELHKDFSRAICEGIDVIIERFIFLNLNEEL